MLTAAAVALMSGCTKLPPIPAGDTTMTPVSPVISMETQSLPPKDVPVPAPFHADEAYRLGPDDVISVSVYNHPELSAPTPGMTANSGGIVVASDGSINLPLIGRVEVGGMTVTDLQDTLNSSFGTVIKQPNVTVQLIAPESLRYYFLGEFTSPGVKYPGHVMTLLDALALGGSVDITNADLYQSYVANGSVKIPVNMHALLVDGDLSQNIELESGDAVIIPPSSDEQAYVFGAVSKPGGVPFHSGELSLLQALSESGMDLPTYTSAQLNQVHLIRAEGASAQYYVIDASKILDGQASNFTLQPGDIVFVPPTSMASWNQVLSMLLPALNTVNGVLNPFVSIKYLTTHTPN